MTQKTLSPLPSVAFAVDEIFGGVTKMAHWLSEKTGEPCAKQTTSGWKRRKHFPPEYTSLLVPEIMAAGYEPRPEHFKQKVAA